MAVVELFIGAFVTVLFEKMASGDLIRLAQSAGIYSELNKWTHTLTLIQAVLVDAGRKHIRDRSVQMWVNKLQHLAYEIDDVLDDLAIEATRHQMNEESYATTSNLTTKVLKFIATKFHTLMYGRKMSSRLNGITNKLCDLVREKNLLGLNDNVGSNRARRRLEETSLVDESKIIGREGDKEVLLKKLLGTESSSSQTQNSTVVSIVGMGGIGKTTLCRLLYNDEKVKGHFDLMAWVCVSHEFDVFNISKAIFQAVGGGNQDFANLDLLQQALSRELSNKKFLLVLDDVWNESYNEWELLQRPLTVGSLGSTILVTTRKTIVTLVMESVEAYPLKILSNEEALSLFTQHALGKQNFDVNGILKLHGEDIIKKCGKLPLALRIAGRVFRTKSSEEEWEELLNNEVWNLDDGKEILPALRLSYYDLLPHLKQMFAYCCLFPKDYMFDKEELVLLWMAEGFLYDSKRNNSMETFGRSCFEALVSRSFFQHLTTDKSRYTMHDVISDLATSVAGEFFFMLDNKMDVYTRNEAWEKVRHLSFSRKQYGVYKNFKPLQRARRLRTFLATSVIWGRFYVSGKVITEVIPQLQFLRVLSLANYNIVEVPPSIGHLKHVRYLNFSGTDIRCLPEQVGDLLNLQSLLLSRCHMLSSLPKSTVKLISLRHLDIRHTPQLNKLPLGIGGLTDLQTLSKVVIGGANDDFKIYDLKGLSHLQGQLSIEGLHNVKNAEDAREANLSQKKGVRELRMEWSDDFDDSRNKTTEYEVLDELRPFEKLRCLKIVCYMGTQFPAWVGDPSFVWLTQLSLRECRNCTCLPPLGHLPSLQKLSVKSICRLKRLASEFLGPCHGVAFPSLEILELKDMDGWEEWSTGGGDEVEAFPRLREISLISCSKLDVVAVELIPSLEVLHVDKCSLSVLRSMFGVSLSLARLKIGNIKGLTRLHEEDLEHLRAVEHLEIYNCNEVTYLWESETKAYEILGSLQKLVVSGCEKLVSLGEKKVNRMIGMESVTDVSIYNCPRLKSYNFPDKIEKLEIDSCSSIAALTLRTDRLPSTLKTLKVTRCDNVDISRLLNNFLSSLETLHIRNMSNPRLFPERDLIHLTSLNIDYCRNIESVPDDGHGFLPFPCLIYLMISNCYKLKSFPHGHLQTLTSMKQMEITKCPRLDDSFPCGLWPPNLTSLQIGGLKKPISEWGLQNFPTSLVELWLDGSYDSGVVSFAKAEDTSSSSFLLPSSITYLSISDFKELESISKSMQHLTCLQHLQIDECPKLRDLPETLLSSLSSLSINGCSSELRKKCNGRQSKYWSTLSQIPDLNFKLY